MVSDTEQGMTHLTPQHLGYLIYHKMPHGKDIYPLLILQNLVESMEV